MDTPRDDGIDPLYELFGPPLRRERKLHCLSLYDPWSRMYRRYQFGPAGLIPISTLGPLKPDDAKDIEQWFREDAA
ncbi:hypothetical protein LMG7141_04148 [Ralstonia condita]|uniref:Uncharacterized protein n=1 Tax=Ralstonia condita TaxID=3058600 RepID=A0ABN9J664_9RALS|nr:hypothetical protein [Ralstonia sp. LMG 7141]CAJ0802710.1 hypothetical protein LMG7141_04148 [Ralstonia sp. LMG 7141]